MIPNIRIINGWKILKEWGDATEIFLATGIARSTFGYAMKRPYKMSEKTFEVLKNFYNEKEVRQKKLQKQANLVNEDYN